MPEDPNAQDVETPSALPIAPGQVIASRYRVGPVLGEGGMGVVCAGTHVLLGTAVAIKLIHSELKHDHEAVQRFVNEARAAAALKGEHIARVFDVGVLPSGEPYLVMERLEGVSLDEHLHGRGPLAPSEAVGIALQVCEGLAEAHAAGIVHRDIKPGNLFLTWRPDGRASVKILDFGIAKQRLRSDSPALTNPGRSLGSPYYMSPEQMLTPASVDERADVWSTGVLLFELLTKQTPFDGESVPQVCANVLAASPRRPRELRPDLPAGLEAIVLRCLQKEPARRFSSVGELAKALLPFAATTRDDASPALKEDVPVVVEAKPVALAAEGAPTFDSFTPFSTSRDLGSHRRSPWRAWPLATALVAVASLLFGGWLQYRDPTLIRSAVSATRIHLPGDPRLRPGDPGPSLQRDREPPSLLQFLHLGRAVAEPQRDSSKPPATWRSPRPRTPKDLPRAGASWNRLTEERYGF